MEKFKITVFFDHTSYIAHSNIEIFFVIEKKLKVLSLIMILDKERCWTATSTSFNDYWAACDKRFAISMEESVGLNALPQGLVNLVLDFFPTLGRNVLFRAGEKAVD